MRNCTPTDAGWYLDEYDGPRFWQSVNFHGGTPYKSDPLASVTDDSDCWLWEGWTSSPQHGLYGRFRLFGRDIGAHRIAFLDFGKKIPDDRELDHLCRTTLCVRPSHLEAVDRVTNVRRGKAANKTHCPSGHAYTEENTVMQYRRNRSTFRYCRTCLAESKRRAYERSKRKPA